MIAELISNEEFKSGAMLLLDALIITAMGVITKWLHGVRKDTKEVNKTVNGRDTKLLNDLDAQGEKIDQVKATVDTLAIAVVKLNNKLDKVVVTAIEKDIENDRRKL